MRKLTCCGHNHHMIINGHFNICTSNNAHLTGRRRAMNPPEMWVVDTILVCQPWNYMGPH